MDHNIQKSRIFTSLVCLLFGLFQLCCAEQCKSLTACVCQMDDGREINLEPIGLRDKPRFMDTKVTNDTSHLVSYNPCYSFSIGNCTTVAGCLNNGTTVGLQSAPQWTLGNETVIFYTSEKSYLSVNLKCEKELNPEKSVFTVDKVGTANGTTTVDATLSSKCACPDACRETAPTKKKGISTGTLLLILFLVFLVLYLVGGMIYKKIITGASGKELIPNIELWISFPGLVLDGVAFTCNCCGTRRTSPGYDGM